MLKKIKYCNQLIELSNNKSEINFLQLKIYIMILGYFACKKDNTFPSFFIHDDIIFKLEERIKNIFNTNYKILGIKNNSLDSFYVFINNVKNDINKTLCDEAIINFIDEYNYYSDIRENSSIFDYLISHKYERLENKLIKKIK